MKILLSITVFLSLMPTVVFAQAPGNVVPSPMRGRESSLVGMNLTQGLDFSFFVKTAGQKISFSEEKEMYREFVEYFLAGLAMPEGDLWVNLSPHEKDRIIPDALGQTRLGQGLLAQDYLLKVMTASLIDPRRDEGREFWQTVYQKVAKEYGRTDIPINTFNKVWIVPGAMDVYQHDKQVVIKKATLKVMLEEDYLALQKQSKVADHDVNALGSQIVRKIVLPALEKEVNEAEQFAPLRQMYRALILGAWYKRQLKTSLTLYANQRKIAGIDQDPREIDITYKKYINLFKKGLFNFIQEEEDYLTHQVVPRRYIAGGFTAMDFQSLHIHQVAEGTFTQAMAVQGDILEVKGRYQPVDLSSKAMNATAALPHQHLRILKEAMYALYGESVIDHIERLAEPPTETEFKARRPLHLADLRLRIDRVRRLIETIPFKQEDMRMLDLLMNYSVLEVRKGVFLDVKNRHLVYMPSQPEIPPFALMPILMKLDAYLSQSNLVSQELVKMAKVLRMQLENNIVLLEVLEHKQLPFKRTKVLVDGIPRDILDPVVINEISAYRGLLVTVNQLRGYLFAWRAVIGEFFNTERNAANPLVGEVLRNEVFEEISGTLKVLSENVNPMIKALGQTLTMGSMSTATGFFTRDSGVEDKRSLDIRGAMAAIGLGQWQSPQQLRRPDAVKDAQAVALLLNRLDNAVALLDDMKKFMEKNLREEKMPLKVVAGISVIDWDLLKDGVSATVKVKQLSFNVEQGLPAVALELLPLWNGLVNQIDTQLSGSPQRLVAPLMQLSGFIKAMSDSSREDVRSLARLLDTQFVLTFNEGGMYTLLDGRWVVFEGEHYNEYLMDGLLQETIRELGQGDGDKGLRRLINKSDTKNFRWNMGKVSILLEHLARMAPDSPMPVKSLTGVKGEPKILDVQAVLESAVNLPLAEKTHGGVDFNRIDKNLPMAASTHNTVDLSILPVDVYSGLIPIVEEIKILEPAFDNNKRYTQR